MLRLEGDRTVKGVAFSPCSRYAAVAGWEAVRVWDLSTGKAQPLTGPVGTYTRAAEFSPDGRRLAWLEGDTACGQVALVTCPFLNGEARQPVAPRLPDAKAFGFLQSGGWVAV